MESLFEAILQGADVRPLLQRGHSPNVYADFPGATWAPLHLAVFGCLPEVAESLLDAGANPNAVILPSPQEGPYAHLVGMTPVDLAVTLDQEVLVVLIVRRGGRPGHGSLAARNRARETLRYELDKARSVDLAQSLVVEPLFLPLVEEAQRGGDWHEADRLLRLILHHDGERTRARHLRIRGLLAQGFSDQAMEEASLIFVSYRSRGRYREALQVARCMRLIDATSGRPYELELEFLVELGRTEEARRCFQQLVELHGRLGHFAEVQPSRVRFDLLRRRPQNRVPSRRPEAWRAPEAVGSGNPGHLPALLDEEADLPEGWEPLRRLWWGTS